MMHVYRLGSDPEWVVAESLEDAVKVLREAYLRPTQDVALLYEYVDIDDITQIDGAQSITVAHEDEPEARDLPSRCEVGRAFVAGQPRYWFVRADASEWAAMGRMHLASSES